MVQQELDDYQENAVDEEMNGPEINDEEESTHSHKSERETHTVNKVIRKPSRRAYERGSVPSRPDRYPDSNTIAEVTRAHEVYYAPPTTQIPKIRVHILNAQVKSKLQQVMKSDTMERVLHLHDADGTRFTHQHLPDLQPTRSLHQSLDVRGLDGPPAGQAQIKGPSQHIYSTLLTCTADPFFFFFFFLQLASKRQRPKPDSKPAMNRRQEPNRQAQR